MQRRPRTTTRSSRAAREVSPLRIALIASSRFPIRQPFAGGLEAHTWMLARGLRRRGHHVSVFAADGSDPDLGVTPIAAQKATFSAAARTDVSMTAEDWLQDHHAYLRLMIELRQPDTPFDVIHNNSLHYLPVATAALLDRPMVTTLHTPPTPWLESAIQAGDCPVHFVAVSQHTATAWRGRIPYVEVITNGVDATVWLGGDGGGPAVWMGRIVPEKGTHLAIEAARLAHVDLEIIGPIGDELYFRDEVEPRLDDHTRYLGHLDQAASAAHVRRASVCLVTPRWDEPYGLVAAEALASGTPVCGFDRGALSEFLTDKVAVLVAPDDVEALARAIPAAARLSRQAARERALAVCSSDVMIDRYVGLYRRVAAS